MSSAEESSESVENLNPYSQFAATKKSRYFSSPRIVKPSEYMSRKRNKPSAVATQPKIDNAVAPPKPVQSVIPFLAVAISGFALTGAMFLWLLRNAGHAYREGYLSKFGFQADVLTWNSDDLTYLGYFVQEDKLVVFLGIVMTAAVLCAGFFLAGNAFSAYMKRRAAKQGVQSDVMQSSEIFTAEVILCGVAAVVLFSLIICSAVPLVLLEPVHYAGVKDANAVMSAVKNWDVAKLKLHSLHFVEIEREKSAKVSGLAISCTDKFCAIYSPNGPAHAKTVPLSDITSWSTLDWGDVPKSEKTTKGS